MKESVTEYKKKGFDNKIQRFCKAVKEMPEEATWVAVFSNKVAKPDLNFLFNNLNKKGRFLNSIHFYYNCKDNDIQIHAKEIETKIQELMNREFLKRFIKDLSNYNAFYRGVKSKKTQLIIDFILICLQVDILISGISMPSAWQVYLGVVNIFACAYLVYILVVSESLATIVLGSIALGVWTIFRFLNAYTYFDDNHKVLSSSQAAAVGEFFKLIGDIQEYLDKYDLPTQGISSGEVSNQNSVTNLKSNDEIDNNIELKETIHIKKQYFKDDK